MSKTTRDKQETKPQKRLESSLEADGEELFVASVTMEHKGPLPHPSILRGYQQIDPTYPDRILTEFEKNSDYVRRCEEKALDAPPSIGWDSGWRLSCRWFFWESWHFLFMRGTQPSRGFRASPFSEC